MLLCLLFSVAVMGVPWRGSLLLLFLVTSVFLGSALGLGLFLSTVMRSQFNAAQAALIAAFLPAVMLSGFVFGSPACRLGFGPSPTSFRPATSRAPADPLSGGQRLLDPAGQWFLSAAAGGFLASPDRPQDAAHSGVTHADPTLVADPKELQALMGNTQGRFLLIMPVLLQTALFPFATTLEVTGNTLAIYNQDGGAQSRELLERLTHMPAFTTIIPVQVRQA